MTQSCQEARELTKAEETEATIGKNTEYHRITYHIIRVYIVLLGNMFKAISPSGTRLFF